MSFLSFLTNREKGLLKNSKKDLNCDFLLSKFVCEEQNNFSVRSASGEGVPPYACQFRKDRCSGDMEILAVASEEGDITLLNSSDLTKNKLIRSWSAHQNAILDICWLPDSAKIISAGGDHTAILWDTVTCEKITTFSNHTGSIKCISVCQEQNSIFATGARDGTVKIWDTRISSKNCCGLITKPDITIFNHVVNKSKTNISPRSKWKNTSSPQAKKNVTCVAFQDINFLASSTCSETAVKIWDLRRTYCEKPKIHPNPKYVVSYRNTPKNLHGSASMVFDSMRKSLYVCCTDDCIYALDCHSYSNDNISVFHGFKAKSFFVKVALSVDDRFLLCGSSDEKAYIWNVSQPGLPLISLAGHSAEVTSVAWHPHKLTTLATCGDDNKVMLWKVKDHELASNENSYSGSAEVICNIEDIPKINDADEIENPILTAAASSCRPLKEISLVRFFSNLNSSNILKDNSSIKDLPRENVSPSVFKSSQRNNFLIEQFPSISSTFALPSSTDKENLENTVATTSQMTSKREINTKVKSPLRQKNPKAKSRSPLSKSQANKKIKLNDTKGNLITSYFQGLSSELQK